MRWFAIAIFGCLLCSRTCESATLQAAESSAEPPLRLVRSEVSTVSINAAAAVKAKHSRGEAAFPSKPHVAQIFYESLCPDSARLLASKSTGLWSSYNSRKDQWRFDLYPSGNTKRDAWNNLVCQHGREECVGNLVHQCALKVLQRTQAFALIDCMMGTVHAIHVAQNASATKEEESTYNSLDLLQVKDVDDPDEDTWTYPGTETQHHEIPKSVTDFKTQVSARCFRKLHQPKWEKLVEECVYDGKLKVSLPEYYATETHRLNFTWVPAVFLNGTFNDKASHAQDLLSFLD